MRFTVRSILCLVALALLGIGCSSTGARRKATTLDTPSGMPEVVIQSPRAEPILASARQFFAGRGYSEAPSRHAYEVIFDRRIQDTKKPRALRIRLRASPIDSRSWRLSGTSMKVEDWRGELASETVVPYGFAQVQQFLEAIKLQMELAH